MSTYRCKKDWMGSECGWIIKYEPTVLGIGIAEREIMLHNAEVHYIGPSGQQYQWQPRVIKQWMCDLCGYILDYDPKDSESVNITQALIIDHNFQHAINKDDDFSAEAVEAAESLVSKHWYDKHGCGCPYCTNKRRAEKVIVQTPKRMDNLGVAFRSLGWIVYLAAEKMSRWNQCAGS